MENCLNALGVLYVVATPIGNLRDITLRALDVLREVDVVVCEDTRRALKLLSHYEIKKHLVALHARNEKESSKKVLKILQDGKNVAYVSDAGTPAISDPGSVLVTEARKQGVTVVPIPGASAAVTLLSVAGVFGKTVIFEGFLSPRQGRRKKRLIDLMETDCSIVIYESPYRMVRLLTDIRDIDENRYVVVGKELTKAYENVIRGLSKEVLEAFLQLKAVKGEYVVLILPQLLNSSI